MKFSILCVGKTRERFVQDGIQKYLRYIKPYADAQITEIKEEKIHDLRDAPSIRRKEAEKIFEAVPSEAYITALDERGQEFTSHEFAHFLNRLFESGVRNMVFIIGGTMGLDEAVIRKAHKTVALGRWTFTHEMARLVLLEQLYRAMTIIKGKPYHY